MQHRGKIKVLDNPHRGQNMWICFNAEQSLPQFDSVISLRLRYLADREIVETDSLANYLNIIFAESFERSLEDIAGLVLSDAYDTLIPFYMDLELEVKAASGLIQRVHMNHAQPKFNLPVEILNIIKN